MLGPIKPSEIKNLSPLPLSVVRLAAIVSDPDSSTSDFVGVIKFDPALTANVLRWANSAWSQSRTPIDEVRNAVIRLGSENILKLAIGYHLMQPMKKLQGGYQLAENELWEHSVAAALAAETIPLVTPVSVPSAAFTAALMHDLGKLILGRHLGMDNLRETIMRKMEDGMTYIDAEREITGTDHALVGAAIAQAWKIPARLTQAIRDHHTPDQTPDIMTDTVHVANAVAKMLGKGLGIEQMNMPVSSASAERLGLQPEKIQTLCALVGEKMEATMQYWEKG